MTNAAIICGNGPSALEMPANPAVPTFGMNYCPFQPTYYVCVDTDVLLSHWDDIYLLALGAEVAYLSGKHVGSSKLYDLRNVELVYKDQQAFRAERFMSGLTAAYVALKLAYYAGFDEVHLWGIDHSPGWEHYRPDYPAPAPDIEYRMAIMREHFQLAAGVYARAGRRIINHSRPSKLDAIFERAR
jgi:hypothetical protein